MGAASCKNSKASESPADKKDQKNITIGVFGLHHAGKTSAVKAIEGDPTADVDPTIGSSSSTVPNPTSGAGGDKNSEMIKIIDVSGEKKFREQSWPQYYNQIHGLIFVFDASERRQLKENKQVLEELLADDALKNKPVLILANKKDPVRSDDDEDEIKSKLQIDKLKTKYKIEFCTAVPQNKKKVDQSIREGFSWLIRAIEADYTQLNARVNGTKNRPQPRDMDKKYPKNEKFNRRDSDDDDSEPTYHKRRAQSPPGRDVDTRWMKPPAKLPNLDLTKAKPIHRNGNETYSENDDDDQDVVSRSRPNVPRIDLGKLDTGGSSNQTGTWNKKKKPVGTDSGDRDGISDLPKKKSSDLNPKSFRSSFETLPEEAPWSSSASKPAKSDSLSWKAGSKPPFSSDSFKRDQSPLTRDNKLPPLGSHFKRDNLSDDENDNSFTRAQKAKPLPSSNNRLPSTTKKPTSGMYDDDDDDDYRSKDFKKPGLQSASKAGKASDSDEEKDKSYLRTSDRFNPPRDYRGTATAATPARSRFSENNLSPSPTKPLTSVKENNDDYLSRLSKPSPLTRFNDEKRPSSASKPTVNARLADKDEDDWKHSPTKPATRPNPLSDDYGSSTKPSTGSKFNNDSYLSATSKPKTGAKFDDEFSTSPKPVVRSRYDDSPDDRPSSSSKLGILSKNTGDYSSSAPANSLSRAKYGETTRPALPIKPTSYSKYGDDDDDDDKYGSSTKSAANRSSYDSKDRLSSSTKPTNRLKFDDDNDDYSSPSKPAARSKFSDDDYSSPTRKPATAASPSKFDDDRSSTKPTATRSTYDSKDRLSSATKPTGHSKFDDDDDDYPSSTRKPAASPTKPAATRSTYDSKDRLSSATKPTGHSKFDDDDDDDYASSTRKPAASPSKFDDDRSPTKPAASRSNYDSKPASRSKYDDDEDDYRPSNTSSKAPTRSKYDDDDDDKYGSSSKPAASRSAYNSKERLSSASKPVTRSNFDDDDDDYPAKNASKAATRSKYDDDEDLYGSPPKSNATRSNYDSKDRTSSSSKPATRSKYDDDDDDVDRSSPSPAKTTTRSKFDDDSYSPSSSRRNLGVDSTKSSAFPKKTDSSSRYDDYGGGSGGARSRFDQDEFGSSKAGSSGARAVSTSNSRQRRNFDDDDL